jgi:hypothetical protein
MIGILGSNTPKVLLLSFVGLLLLSAVAFTLTPVAAQPPFDLSWAFDYSPLVSAAPNSVHLHIQNTALGPTRLLSVGIRFPWMNDSTYLTAGGLQTPVDLSPGQVVMYTISFQIPDDVLTGRYSMDTFLQYQVFQTVQWGGQESIAYVLDVTLIGRNSPFSITFDPYDGRFYAAVAFFTLLGWYLPKRFLHRAKG